jgi:cation:H+ antiporter
MIEFILWIVFSLVLLFLGAEWLVRGSSALALRLGITPLVIGLTVVAYGTSMPEMVVSTVAALKGQGNIAVGNVVGSNIFNVCVILGLSALALPLQVKVQLIRLDAPLMVGVSLLFVVFFRDFHISRGEAGLLLAGIIVYTVGSVIFARKEVSAEVQAEFTEAVVRPRGKLWRDLLLILGGLAVLVLGSRLLVTNAVELARLLGISEAVIGLTIVAAGTSMPELATSVVAAFRKQADIAIGNIVGSNLYNLLAIVGVSGLLAPLHAPGIRMLDLYVMLGTSIALLPLMWSGFVLKRWEGAVLLAAYGGYLYVLWPK